MYGASAALRICLGLWALGALFRFRWVEMAVRELLVDLRVTYRVCPVCVPPVSSWSFHRYLVTNFVDSTI